MTDPDVDASLAKFFPSQRETLAVGARVVNRSYRMLSRAITLFIEPGDPDSSGGVLANKGSDGLTSAYCQRTTDTPGGKAKVYEASFYVAAGDTIRPDGPLTSIVGGDLSGDLSDLQNGQVYGSQLGRAAAPVNGAALYIGPGASFGAGFVDAKSNAFTNSDATNDRIATLAVFIFVNQPAFSGIIGFKSSISGKTVVRVKVDHQPG